MPPAKKTFLGESLAIRYLASFLNSYKYKTEILECDLSGIDSGSTPESLNYYDVIGFSLNYSGHYPAAKKMIRTIAGRMEHERQSKIIIGGNYATFQAGFILGDLPEVDVVVLGEGERAVLELLNNDFTKLADIANIAYRAADGGINYSRKLSSSFNIDSYPFPLRDKNSNTFGFSIISSRGCYANCAYCSSVAFAKFNSSGRRWRQRSPENLLEEIRAINDKHGAREIAFADDAFIGPDQTSRDRAQSFCSLMKEQKIDITFSIQCRPEAIEEDILGNLKSVGLKRVLVGVESGCTRALMLFNKQTSLSLNSRAIKVLQKIDIDTEYGFIMFYPEMEYEDFLTNLEFLHKHGIIHSKKLISRLSIYHGTEYSQRHFNGVDVRDNQVIIGYVFHDKRLEELHGRLIEVYKIISRVEERIVHLKLMLINNYVSDEREVDELRRVVSSARIIINEDLYKLAKKLYLEIHNGVRPSTINVEFEANMIRMKVESVVEYAIASVEGRLGGFIGMNAES